MKRSIAKWKAAVSGIAIIAEVDLPNLPGTGYTDMYESGMTPSQTVAKIKALVSAAADTDREQKLSSFKKRYFNTLKNALKGAKKTFKTLKVKKIPYTEIRLGSRMEHGQVIVRPKIVLKEKIFTSLVALAKKNNWGMKGEAYTKDGVTLRKLGKWNVIQFPAIKIEIQEEVVDTSEFFKLEDAERLVENTPLSDFIPIIKKGYVEV